MIVWTYMYVSIYVVYECILIYMNFFKKIPNDRHYYIHRLDPTSYIRIILYETHSVY